MNYKKLHPLAKIELPRNGDCGIDLYSLGEFCILPHEVLMVSTGISLEIPDGFFGKVMERSSVGVRGIAARGGVIDSSYRGEIKVLLHNLSQETQYFSGLVKVAQLVLIPHHTPDELTEVCELSLTERGEKGFGSTDE